jgi:hypothetical protein
MQRRGLLGMFAAGVGASILPSGIIMPIRSIIQPLPLSGTRTGRITLPAPAGGAWKSVKVSGASPFIGVGSFITFAGDPNRYEVTEKFGDILELEVAGVRTA